MKRTNKIILTVVIVAMLLLGIGYAAIQNITLNISGTASADPSQSNFKVMFSGTPTVSDDTYVTAAVTDDTNATINVEGLTKKGDVATVTFTVQNTSEDLSSDLSVSTTNNNTEYFALISELGKPSLVAGEATTLMVTVELTKTPIVESVSATIGVQLESMPVQPGEEGTSEGANDFSQTPDNRNEYGFYFDKLYVNEENGYGFIAHQDGSAEEFVYVPAGELYGLTSGEWMCSYYYSAGEYDYADLDEEIIISSDGKIINLFGTDFVISNYNVHGVYYGNEYSATFKETYEDGEGNEYVDEYEYIITLYEDGSVKLSVDSDGEIEDLEYVENVFEDLANGYFLGYGGITEVICSATGDVIYWDLFDAAFKIVEKHNYVSKVTRAVTCTEDGEIMYSCTRCNKNYTTIVKATNHENDIDNNEICDDCGDEIIYEEVSVSRYNRDEYGYSDDISELFILPTRYDKINKKWYKVTEIGGSTFENCTNLTKVVIPESVTTINSDSFRSCINLTNLVLPDNLVTINDFAFRGCEGLIEIDIPSKVNYVGYAAFDLCSSLTTINVDSDNLNYCSVNGILYNKDMTSLLRYPEGKKDDYFSIPEGVTEIGSHAFYRCSNLTNVVMPESVTIIGYYAFYDCLELTNIIIPERVTTIKSSAFYGCEKITNIVIPEGVTSIEEGTFNDCSSLISVVIPRGVTKIDREAFSSCDSLTNVVIPEGVKTISERTFTYCYKLESVVIPSSVTSINDLAFNACRSLTTVNYTGTKEQWEAIQFGTLNEYLTNATINYNYVMPTE